MTAIVEFYFDVSCPYAWLAAAHMESFLEGATVRWCPLVLGDLRRVVGTTGREDPPARAAVRRRDLQHWASFWGTSVRAHSVGGRHAARAVWSCNPQLRPRLATALMMGAHQQGGPLDDEAWVESVAAQFSVHTIDEAAADAGLREVAATAAAAGVFGVPSWVTPQGVVYGQDRMGILAGLLGESLDPTRWARGRGGPTESHGATSVEVDLFHDFASPFSYLASTAVERVAQRHGVSVKWRPILLGGLFREIGTPEVPLFAMSDAQQAWTRADLEAWAQALDAPFRFPDQFPMRSILPLRASIVEPRLIGPIYRAAWADNIRVDTPDALTEIVVGRGLDPHAVARGVGEPETKAHLRANTDEARAIGICGVPSFVVRRGDGESLVLWGQDRLVHLDAALGGWWPCGPDGDGHRGWPDRMA